MDRMSRSSGKPFKSPHCRYCGRSWTPRGGKSGATAYCDRCADERRAAAAKIFSLRKLSRRDVAGKYLLSRSTRREHP